jgi:hypothetical protein
MPGQAWTWDAQEHPSVAGALVAPAADLDWCDRLETAPGDAIVGKVLSVCAAAAIAQEVLAARGSDGPQAAAALELLDHWIDEPTDERFAHICSLIFGEETPELDPHGVVWWALRTATGSVGNFEAGWALGSLCSAASEAGLTAEQMRATAERVLSSRARPVGWSSARRP